MFKFLRDSKTEDIALTNSTLFSTDFSSNERQKYLAQLSSLPTWMWWANTLLVQFIRKKVKYVLHVIGRNLFALFTYGKIDV